MSRDEFPDRPWGARHLQKRPLPKEIAAQVPLDRLLIETDAPYLAPHPHRGKRNESGYVRLVAEKIAELRGISFEEVARQTAANACRLFRIEEAA